MGHHATMVNKEPYRKEFAPQAGKQEGGSDMRHLRIALAQINSTVGDLEGNLRLILANMAQDAQEGAELICFPELALTGYPPEDLLLKPGFVADNLRALDTLVQRSADYPALTIVMGFVDRQVDIYNAAAVIHNGRLVG